jgi:hypothetical protein
MTAHNVTSDNQIWKHRSGDAYVLLVSRINGNPESGYTTDTYVPSGVRHESKAVAIREGFIHCGCDDFNVGVIRGGRLAAVLWMDEVVDDEPSEIADRAAALGVPS